MKDEGCGHSRLLLNGFDDGGEGFGFVDSQLSQDLAIEGDVSGFEAGDQLAVGGAVQAGAGVDAGVPDLAESALFVAAVAGGKLQRFGDGLTTALDTDPVRMAKT